MQILCRNDQQNQKSLQNENNAIVTRISNAFAKQNATSMYKSNGKEKYNTKNASDRK